MKALQQRSGRADQPVAETLDTIAAGVKVAAEVVHLMNLLSGGGSGVPACMPNYHQLLAQQGFAMGYDPSTLLAEMGLGVDYSALMGNSFGFDFGSFNSFSW